jgi:multidrug efflux pump subunit AcrA (membrane-fusion protein)
VVPLQEVTISAQVQGEVLPTDKLLQEGKYYRKGEVLLRIDRERLDYQLRSQRAQLVTQLVATLSDLSIDYPAAHPRWEAFTNEIDVAHVLPELPKITDEQLTYFISARGIPASYYRIRAQEATLDDYTVRAPFSGVLTSARVDPGAVVSPGAPLATLSRTDIYEVRTAVPATSVPLLQTGQQIELRAVNLDEHYTATVNRLGAVIDENSQTVTAFLRLSGKHLRSGLYLEGELPGRTLEEVAELPKEALTRDNHVYRIVDSTVVLHPVTTVLVEADRVYLRGLEDGMEIITQHISSPIAGTRAR